MKINRDRLEIIGAIISIIFIISLFIVPIFTSRAYEKKCAKIIKDGKFTIGFVYRQGGGGATMNISIFYFYFIKCKKKKNTYSIRLSHSNKVKPLLKFYKIYYLPNDENKSVPDFSHEIPIDSVKYYFPEGKNPFAEEIKNIKEGNYRIRNGFETLFD